MTMPASFKRRPSSTLVLALCMAAAIARAAVQEAAPGFSTAHDPSYSQFQPLLSDPTGAFSLGFLRLNSSLLDLAVLHLPSSLPLWRALPASPAAWSAPVSVYFNGTLVLSDRRAGVLWVADAAGVGDRLVLLNSSNLQIQKSGEPTSVLWQSFDFPSDTLVQGQNFTPTAALLSSNQRFSMSLGTNYIALYMVFGSGAMAAATMYWKHTALEAKAQIVSGGGPIYARVEPAGFLGMYQQRGPPADVLAFDSFNRGVVGFRRLTLEPDGNLRAFYWNGSAWVLDFTAISDHCGLPTICGAYGLCGFGEPQCTCLANGTEGGVGCPEAGFGDFCGAEGGEFYAVRRKGVDLANKELLGFVKVASLDDCEAACERNCSCWGAVYSNATGYCYRLDYPIQTLVEGDKREWGYFKVRDGGGGGRGAEEEEAAAYRRMRVALLVVGSAVLAAAAAAAAGFGAYRIWQRRRWRAGVDGSMVEGLAQGPYKGLGSASFKSIELSDSARK